MGERINKVTNIIRDIFNKREYEKGVKDGVKQEKKARRSKLFNRAVGAAGVVGIGYGAKKAHDKYKQWKEERRSELEE